PARPRPDPRGDLRAAHGPAPGDLARRRARRPAPGADARGGPRPGPRLDRRLARQHGPVPPAAPPGRHSRRVSPTAPGPVRRARGRAGDARGGDAGTVVGRYGREMVVPGDLEVPIVAAPMAGGPSTPALAAALDRAGGLGFLGSGYLTDKAMREQIDAARAGGARRFGVNLFV